MSLTTNHSTGTADPVDVEYLHHEPEGAPVRIHMHLDAVDGMARDVIEGFSALPRRGIEVGGLLLGRVIGSEHPDVWIERYQRIECEHRFGPQFVLDTRDHVSLEQAAQRIAASTDLAVVGLYRSHTRSGFQLEESDLELIGRYFSDPADLVLLIRPENLREISAQFYGRDASGAITPLGKPFPFRGHVVGPAVSILVAQDDPMESTRETEAGRQAGTAEPPVDPKRVTEVLTTLEASDAAAPVGEQQESPSVETPPAPDAQRERVRRLVPDFTVAEPVEPGGVFSFEPRKNAPPPPAFTMEPEPARFAAIARWWPLAGALVLVGGAMWLLFGNARIGAPGQPQSADSGAQEYRPVGMYVDPGAQRWRVSWNPAATAFRDARSVALFVRDGDGEDRIDLAKQDVTAGVYSYQPKSNDVTFRLEAIDGAGRISAESFRVIRAPGSVSTASAPAPPPPPVAPADNAAPKEPPAHVTAAKATHKVPPVVPASIRPRIHASIPIDVRVHIDERGRVVAAAPTEKGKSGLDRYLALRAVYAAKLWKFAPARENGKPVASTQTIHFVFEK